MMINCPSCGEFVGSLADHPIGPDGKRSCQTKSNPNDPGIRTQDDMAHQAFGGPKVTEPSKSDQAGQGLAEYALILALIFVIAIAALVFLGTQISQILSQIGANI